MATFTPPQTGIQPLCLGPDGALRPWRYYVQPVFASVVLRNGRYQSAYSPAYEEVSVLVEGETWFQGGKTYEVTPAVEAALEADGFTVVD